MTRPEIELIAEFMGISAGRLKRDYLKRIGLRTTIVERESTKDCAFLGKIGGRTQCLIYEVRPSQCRSWPFWPSNLASGKAWNEATSKCPGVNRGRLYSYEEIQEIKKLKRWWQQEQTEGGQTGSA